MRVKCWLSAPATMVWHSAKEPTMEFKDYYQVLGVERQAEAAEIKKAYRRLVRKHHPDVSKAADAQVRMQEINEAWEVLQDPEKRAAYDRLGQRWQGGGDFQPPPDWDAGFEFSGAPQGWAPSQATTAHSSRPCSAPSGAAAAKQVRLDPGSARPKVLTRPAAKTTTPRSSCRCKTLSAARPAR